MRAERAVQDERMQLGIITAQSPDNAGPGIALRTQHTARTSLRSSRHHVRLTGAKLVLTYSPEAFNKVMQVNLAGSFFLAQTAARQMKDQSAGGSILFISSVTGHQAHKNLAAYGMSKAALEMLAKNLVIELSQYKINVNAIAPGATVTERTMQDPSYNEIWSRITPMGKPALVQDIANTVLFLVSDRARHITGQTLIVDGGWTSVSPCPDQA